MVEKIKINDHGDCIYNEEDALDILYNNPEFDISKFEDKEKEYPVSFNGKVRFTLKLPLELTIEQIKEKLMNEEKTLFQLGGRSPKKIIVIPGKIINIVI